MGGTHHYYWLVSVLVMKAVSDRPDGRFDTGRNKEAFALRMSLSRRKVLDSRAYALVSGTYTSFF
jgi:hypothetical protein